MINEFFFKNFCSNSHEFGEEDSDNYVIFAPTLEGVSGHSSNGSTEGIEKGARFCYFTPSTDRAFLSFLKAVM
jgi:hypothetical protein